VTGIFSTPKAGVAFNSIGEAGLVLLLLDIL
jgi:hypothetical protein